MRGKREWKTKRERKRPYLQGSRNRARHARNRGAQRRHVTGAGAS